METVIGTVINSIWLGSLLVAVIGVFSLALYTTSRKNDEDEKDDFVAKNPPTFRTEASGEYKVFTVNIPVGIPNKNGDVFTKEAVEKALEGDYSMGYTDPSKKKAWESSGGIN